MKARMFFATLSGFNLSPNIVRYIVVFGIVIGLLSLNGCANDATSPVVSDTTVTPVAPRGYQLVAEAARGTFFNSAAVYSTRTDQYVELDVSNTYYLNGSAVFTQRAGQNDTTWVGYAVFSDLYRQDFPGQVTWSLSGAIRRSSADTTKIKVGVPSSVYQTYTSDINNYGYLINSSVVAGLHALEVDGNNFRFTELFTWSMPGNYIRRNIAVFLWPVVCADFFAQKISSLGITEVQSDSTRRFSGHYDVPDITLTCNPSAPTAAVRGVAPQMKLADYLATHPVSPMLRRQ